MQLHHTVNVGLSLWVALTLFIPLHRMERATPPRFASQSPMAKQIFYDPQRKRWKRLRVLLDSLALAGLILATIFLIGLIRMKPLPELLLESQKRNYRTLANQSLSLKSQKLRRSAHRKTDLKPSDVPLNSGEGLRAAYYVADDPGSYSSLKQHISQIDILFPSGCTSSLPRGT